jgi:hypothetical protein
MVPRCISLSYLLLGSFLLVGCADLGRMVAPGTEGTARNAAAVTTQLPAHAPALYIPGLPRPNAEVSDKRPATQVPESPPSVLPALQPAKFAEDAGANPESRLRDLYNKAVQKHASMDSYILRLRRREMVGEQKMPEEVMLFKFRQEPWSVYFKWLGTEGKGREVVYVKGHFDNNLHVRLAAGDILLLPAGKRMAFAPDSALVRAKSRYPITEAGLGPLIVRFGTLVKAIEKGDRSQGTAKYLGQLKRPEYENKLEAVLHAIPPTCDPLFPRGGQRLWFFDPALQLPVLVISQDDAGREVEYYCHDRIQFPVGLDSDDFNPDVLWK